MNYVVEIAAAPPDALQSEEVVSRLAEAFELSDEKAKSLLNRAPGIVTKPIGFREAELIAERFRRAGLKAVTRPQESSSSQNPVVSKRELPDVPKPQLSTNDLNAKGFDSKFDSPYEGFKQDEEGFEAFSLKRETKPTPNEVTPASPERPNLGKPGQPVKSADTNAEQLPPNKLKNVPPNEGAPPKRQSKRELTPVSLPSSFFEEGLRQPTQAPSAEAKVVARPPIREASPVITPTQDDATSDATFWRRQLAAILLALSSLVLGVLFLTSQLSQTLRLDAGQTTQTLATVLANNLEQVPATSNDTSYLNRVQFNLTRLQAPLRTQGVRFALVNEPAGTVVAGWYGDSALRGNVPERLQTLVNEQLLRQPSESPHVGRSVQFDNEQLSLGSSPVSLNGRDGTLLLARSDLSSTRAQQLAWRTFLAGLIPILLWLLALLFSRLRQQRV